MSKPCNKQFAHKTLIQMFYIK